MDTVDDDKLLCYCKNVRYGAVRRAIEELDARSVEEVTAKNQAGGGCRSCHPEIRALIAEHRRARGSLVGNILKRLFSKS